MSAQRTFLAPEGQASENKTAWRKAVRSHLQDMSQADIEMQSSKALARLKSLEVYQAASRISVFLSMPTGELQTRAVVLDALRGGKQVFVPYICKTPNQMHMMQLDSEEDFHALRPDPWGIPSLDTTTINSRSNCFGYKGLAGDPAGVAGLDVVLMPAVAFDHEFNRLGHGKGYYDKWLKRSDNHQDLFPRPYLLGLALSEQVLPPPLKLPTADWDEKVDAVLSADQLHVRESNHLD